MPSTPSLAPLLAADVRHVGVLDQARIHAGADEIADDEARAVRIRQDDQAPAFGQGAQQALFLFVVENGEAPGLEDDGVHHLAQGVFVIAPLDDDDLLNPVHSSPPRRCAQRPP